MFLLNAEYSLSRINSWWKTGEVEQFLLHKRIRSEFSEIVRSIGDRTITNIQGPACVGKTALLYHTVHYLLGLKTEPRRIVMFGGNDDMIFGEYGSIGSVLEAYSTGILHENIYELKSPVYVLIDDVELIDDWQVYALNYTRKTANLKFIVAQCLSKQSRNDPLLPENFNTQVTVMPLTQTQFTDFYSAYVGVDIDIIAFKSLLPDCHVLADPADYYSQLASGSFALSAARPSKARVTEAYLQNGGYPGFFRSADNAAWHSELLGMVLERGIYRDIAAIQNIKSPQKLKKLMYLIAAYGAVEQSYGNIGRTLYIDTATIINYTAGLQYGGYAAVAENYSAQATGSGVVRKNKRMYVLDTGMRNALLKKESVMSDLNPLVLNSCFYMAQSYAIQTGSRVYFWRDGRHNVDIVVDGKQLLPISISYEKEVLPSTLKSINSFMRSCGADTALIITRDQLKRNGNIYSIPYWLL